MQKQKHFKSLAYNLQNWMQKQKHFKSLAYNLQNWMQKQKNIAIHYIISK